jgi:ribosomal-protein-alanine N-acetyltransferase
MIELLQNDDDARACAAMMCTTDPWITIGRGFDECLAAVGDPAREVWLAREDGAVRGFIIINMRGAFIGYIQTVCVDAGARGSGFGTRLVAFAEERIFRETQNVFLCVSSFNPRARALYERLGYEAIGELKDYIIEGASEILMRKTLGPLRPKSTT